MTAELYKNQLLEKCLVDTRSSAITDAISELHKAFAACDVTNRNTVRDLFGDLTVDQMITYFAKTEDLAKDIFDQDREPLEDRIYSMVKESLQEDMHRQTKDYMNDYIHQFDFATHVDDYIRSKIDTLIEDPVNDEVRRILDDASVTFHT